MKTLLLLSLLRLPLLLATFAYAGQTLPAPPDGSAVAVLGFKWSKARQAGEKIEPDDKAPARAVIPANKNFQRNARVNDPVGARDPNADTIDGRSAAIEKSVQEARAPKTKAVDGYSYRARVRNAGAKLIEIVFWEYQFAEPARAAGVVRRQFLCGAQIKPGKEKELQAFSTFGPSDVVSAAGAAADAAHAARERVVINRVEFADGTIWQRRDWNFGEIRQAYARAVSTPWSPGEMCRRL